MGVYVVECRECGKMWKASGTESMGCVETHENCPRCDGDGYCFECDLPKPECVCEKEDA